MNAGCVLRPLCRWRPSFLVPLCGPRSVPPEWDHLKSLSHPIQPVPASQWLRRVTEDARLGCLCLRLLPLNLRLDRPRLVPASSPRLSLLPFQRLGPPCPDHQPRSPLLLNQAHPNHLRPKLPRLHALNPQHPLTRCSKPYEELSIGTQNLVKTSWNSSR